MDTGNEVKEQNAAYFVYFRRNVQRFWIGSDRLVTC